MTCRLSAVREAGNLYESTTVWPGTMVENGRKPGTGPDRSSRIRSPALCQLLPSRGCAHTDRPVSRCCVFFHLPEQRHVQRLFQRETCIAATCLLPHQSLAFVCTVTGKEDAVPDCTQGAIAATGRCSPLPSVASSTQFGAIPCSWKRNPPAQFAEQEQDGLPCGCDAAARLQDIDRPPAAQDS